MTADDEPQRVPPRPHDRMGRYVLQRVIGSGALGTVWAATDPELDRAVAIKIFHADAAKGRTRASFLREAQATARLVHHNVVTIHDVGIAGDHPTSSDAPVFVAMELVEGPTLREWLQTPRTWREILDVMREAALGLAAAHDAGIVHRDFKPDNVLLELRTNGTVGRVVVTDFGLAAGLDPATASITRADIAAVSEPDALEVTQDGALPSHSAYLAPEQRAGSCDARSDQFSFCATLHEALPARAAPRWVRAVALRGLARAATDRFPDMRGLLAALDPQRRRRRATIALAMGSCATALALAGLSRPADPPRVSYCDRVGAQLDGVWDAEIRRDIEAAFTATHEPSARDAWTGVSARIDAFALAWVDAQTEACHAQADDRVPRDVLALRMMCLDRQLGRARAITEALRVADRDAVLRSSESVSHLGSPEVCSDHDQLSRRAAARADVDLPAQLELDGLLSRAEALAHTAKFDASEDVAVAALEKARAVGDRWALAEALLAVAIPRQWRQEPTAEQAYHDALSAALAVEHHRVAAMAMLGLLELWDANTAGGVQRAEQWERHCAATISALGGDTALEIEMTVAIGNVYLKLGRYDEADAAYRRAIALRGEGDRDIMLAGAHANLGSIAAVRGRYQEALDGFRHGYTLVVEVYGPRHPNAASAAINVGSALAELGDLEGARDQHAHALEILEENFGLDHASLAPALRMLAWNALARRQYAEALPYAERALAIARREAGERDESTARSLSMVASIELELGHTEAAATKSQAALDIARTAFGDGHPMLAEFEIECGIAATRAGKDDAARRHFASAIEVRERSLGPDDSEIGRAWTGLAELELGRGRSEAAIAAATRAYEIATVPANDRGVDGPEAAFLLARALTAGGHRERARVLAEEARADFLAVGPAWRTRADDIEAWLQQSSRDRSPRE